MSRPLKSDNHPIDPIVLGNRLHRRRQSVSITQEELAARIGCSLTHLNRIEGGRLPSLHLLYALCIELDYSMDTLLNLKPSENPNIVKLLDLMSRFNDAEQNFAIKLLSDLDFFYHDMHKRSLYNRYSKAQKPYLSEEDAGSLWAVAEEKLSTWKSGDTGNTSMSEKTKSGEDTPDV